MRHAVFSVSIALSALSFLPSVHAVAAPPPELPSLERAHAAAARHLTGQQAYEVTAFVEERWRLPGNRGFDESIARVVQELEAAGYVEETAAAVLPRLTFRVERRPMGRPSWEPIDGVLTIVGDADPLLDFSTNRNMLAINSCSTEGPVEAELIDIGSYRRGAFDDLDVTGKIVLADGHVGSLHREAVLRRGALGVLAYNMPPYTQPEIHRDSIQFSRVGLHPQRTGWGILLSHRAREALRHQLSRGPVRLRVDLQTKFRESDELTLIAEVRGSQTPDQRFVLSAHVQEPGANDNASGVGCLTEAASALARLVRDGDVDPARTITMIWGDEITAPARYLREDAARAAGVRWGLSLDMVGEDTSRTGGTFLIEKMPDPSAIWTRGDEEHTEWGAPPPPPIDSLQPHYFNDLTLACCRRQARDSGWIVKTNPYEGGSDHVPFLRAGKPSVLFWHFTDAFYHTDGDRIDKVSRETLRNVAAATLSTTLMLSEPDENTVFDLLQLIEHEAGLRLTREVNLSAAAIDGGAMIDDESLILRTWANWYRDAVRALDDVPLVELTEAERTLIDVVAGRIDHRGSAAIEELSRR